jgi:hypothetical protein
MVYDSLVLAWTCYVPGQGFVLDSESRLFLAHHLATIFYMTTSRICGAGQRSALTCIFLGEFTNPAYSTYRIYGIAKRVGLTFSPFYTQFVMPVEVFTAALFLLLRTVIGPVVSSYVSYNLLFEKSIRAYTPLALRLVLGFPDLCRPLGFHQAKHHLLQLAQRLHDLTISQISNIRSFEMSEYVDRSDASR